MSSEWPLVAIGEVAQLFDGPHATPKKTKTGPVFLGISSLKRGQLDLSKTEHLSEGDFAKWTKRVVPAAEDIVFSYETRIGEVAVIPSGLRCCLGRRMALLRPDKTRLLPSFLLYYFLSDEFQLLLNARTIHGSTVDRLPLTDFPSYPVRIPPLGVQKTISNILQSFDDRITLLRETNATLEAIAQALFKSWFIDFDPVRAKMSGCAPEGMDEATAALFPDALEETELGLVPNGWLATKLGAAIEQFGGVIQTGPFGSQLHASDYVERGTPVAMPKDLDQRRISEASIARVDDEHVQRLAKHQLKVGDIIFSRRGDVERHALITPIESGWLCGTGCLLVRPGTAWHWSTFLSMHLDTPAVKAWLVQHAVGATMLNLNTGILSAVPMLLPSIELLDSFEGIVAEFEKKRSENFAMIGTLAAMRDELLPRLISGQLRLPEAQAQLEEALA